MARGGKRPGAGRKKGFSGIEAEKTREYITQRLGESLEPIVDVLIKRAKQGDIRATRELFDRALGRAPQGVQISTDAGTPIIFQIPMEIASKYGLAHAPQS